MQTFTENVVLGNIPNAERFWQLIEYAMSKGVPVFKETGKDSYKIYPNIVFSSGNLCGNCSAPGDEYFTWITSDQFFEYCDNWQKCQPKIVKLNDQYTAEILTDKVKVGCQYFTFQAIETLYNEIKNKPTTNE